MIESKGWKTNKKLDPKRKIIDVSDSKLSLFSSS